jgi:hypothetical protein
MRAERLGSYSIEATVAGTPILSRLKSILRKRRLWPPPRKREVIRPVLLRPPVAGLDSVSALTGSLPWVSSEKSGETRPRTPGVIGLCVRRPI